MAQRQTDSNNTFIAKRVTDLKLLFVVDSKSDSENTTFKIIVFSKITSENTMVLPATPESIKGMTGVTCKQEEVFEFRGEKYQTFAIELYSGRDIGHAIAVDESNKLPMINVAPTNDPMKGISLVYPTSSTDNRMTFYIRVKPEDILNGYLYGCSTPDNQWFNFVCKYLNWYEFRHPDMEVFCRSDDRHYILRLNKYTMKYNNRSNVGNEAMNPNISVGTPNNGTKLSKIVSLEDLTYCPVAVKTFKTPIQDQRLADGDVELAMWIGDREIISINSVVSDNKLIRTVIVKK